MSNILGTVWRDLDKDGILENEEPGLSGVTVYLDLNDDNEPGEQEPTTVTLEDNPDTTDIDETGQYEFNDLEAGTYIVRELAPEGLEQTFPFDGVEEPDLVADVVLDYFDSGAGPTPGPYGFSEFEETDGTITPVTLETALLEESDDFEVFNALSLPTDSSITVAFTDEVIVDGQGNDVAISEAGISEEIERADIFVSSDLVNFLTLPAVERTGIPPAQGSSKTFPLQRLGRCAPPPQKGLVRIY